MKQTKWGPLLHSATSGQKLHMAPLKDTFLLYKFCLFSYKVLKVWKMLHFNGLG